MTPLEERTMSQAWVYQKLDDVQALGEDHAPWLVGWREPDGRRKSKTFPAGPRGKKLAEGHRRNVEAQLLTGTYEMKSTVLWDDFVREYTRRILDGLDPQTKRCSLDALGHFKRLCKPVRVFGI